ncbi:MAG: hypothetical protein J7L14_03945, partial [Candidatus Diapherotrites archaeon]|nr:hypothetical protein [Candidatus Diapherotrites archaeon]
MCGIIGCIANKEVATRTIEAVKELKPRGKDGFGLYVNGRILLNSWKNFHSIEREAKKLLEERNIILGHSLHAIVSSVKQPIKLKNSILVANHEIYNWKDIAKKEKIDAKNDAELLAKYLEKYAKGDCKSLDKKLELLDGVFAFAFLTAKKLIVARDLLGVKPLVISCDKKNFVFASERNIVEKIITRKNSSRLLFPRHLLFVKEKNGSIEIEKIQRSFFSTVKKKEKRFDVACKKIMEILEEAVRKRLTNKNAVLFSGGIDSTLMAAIMKKLLKNKEEIELFHATIVDKKWKPGKDLNYAKKQAEILGLKLNVIKIEKKEALNLIPKIARLINSNNPMKVAVALPLYAACKEASKRGFKAIFSGLGADELFAGYARFKEEKIDLDSLHLLRNIYENDLYRDDVISMHNSIEIRLPYLDHKLIEAALKLDDKIKTRKRILAELLKKIERKAIIRDKKSMQYGSNAMKLLRKTFPKGIAKWLERYAKEINTAALFSGGKDSMLATIIAERMGYNVCCLTSIIADQNSMLYHPVNEKIIKLQANAMGKPLIVRKATNKREEEALRDALAEAVEKYNIEAIVSGAIESNFQRKRFDKICEELGLRHLAPLWHKEQS